MVEGKAVAAPGPDRGIVFQHFALFPWKTVRGNILYGLERQGLPRAEREQRAKAFIDLVGLRRLRGQLPVAAVRRHETAHSDRPYARLRSQYPADGRTVRRARRTNPFADADRIAQHLATHTKDRYFRHPRRAGGGLSRRPRGGDVGTTGPDQSAGRHQVRSPRPEHVPQKAFVEKVDELWNLVRVEALKAREDKAP